MTYNKYRMSWIWLHFKKGRLKEDVLRTNIPNRLLQGKQDQFVLSFPKYIQHNGLKIEVNKIHAKHWGDTTPLSNSKDNETLEQITKVLLTAWML